MYDLEMSVLKPAFHYLLAIILIFCSYSSTACELEFSKITNKKNIVERAKDQVIRSQESLQKFKNRRFGFFAGIVKIFEEEPQMNDLAIRVSGEFEGDIREPTKILIIEPASRVKGDVDVQTLILHGYLEGHVKASETVEMSSSAYFKGTLESPSLSIEIGAVFRGVSRVSK